MTFDLLKHWIYLSWLLTYLSIGYICHDFWPTVPVCVGYLLWSLTYLWYLPWPLTYLSTMSFVDLHVPMCGGYLPWPLTHLCVGYIPWPLTYLCVGDACQWHIPSDRSGSSVAHTRHDTPGVAWGWWGGCHTAGRCGNTGRGWHSPGTLYSSCWMPESS